MNHLIKDTEVAVPHIICGAGHAFPLTNTLCAMCLNQRKQPDPRETNYIRNMGGLKNERRS